MENRRALLISGVCFAIAIGLIWGYVQVKREELTSEFGDEVQVVVAAVDIKEYETIRPDMLKKATLFKAFRQPQTVEDIEDLVLKSAYVPIAKGEQITLTKLIHQDGRPVLDRQVEREFRAVTLLISEHTGVGRLIRPGNRVDILAVPSYELKGETLMEVKTIVQNALVLATGKRVQNEVPSRVNTQLLGYLQGQFERQRRKDFYGGTPPNTSRPTDKYQNITVQLTRPDAEKVLYVTNTYGDRSLYFVLRNGADDKRVALATTLLDDVLGPESDFGKTKIRPKPVRRRQPRYFDYRDGKAIPVY